MKKHTQIGPTFGIALASLLGLGLAAKLTLAATSIAISQTPLTITTPTRPQVVLAVTNSQSMDGSTITYCNGTGNSSANCDSNGFSTSYTGRGGAIMTGSGTISGMASSASPTSYTVPTGFVPPRHQWRSRQLAALYLQCRQYPDR